MYSLYSSIVLWVCGCSCCKHTGFMICVKDIVTITCFGLVVLYNANTLHSRNVQIWRKKACSHNLHSTASRNQSWKTPSPTTMFIQNALCSIQLMTFLGIQPLYIMPSLTSHLVWHPISETLWFIQDVEPTFTLTSTCRFAKIPHWWFTISTKDREHFSKRKGFSFHKPSVNGYYSSCLSTHKEHLWIFALLCWQAGLLSPIDKSHTRKAEYVSCVGFVRVLRRSGSWGSTKELQVHRQAAEPEVASSQLPGQGSRKR